MAFSILYITINESITSKHDGVSKKLVSKIEAVKEKTSQCVLLNAIMSLSHSEIKLLQKSDFLINIEIGVKEVNRGYFNKINIDKLFYKKLVKYVNENNLNLDRIIFRYPFASKGLYIFTKDFFKKIVFEHNTKETEELSINIKNKNYANFSLRPSNFFFWLQEKIYPKYCEKFLAKRIFSNAYAGSCVTSEISEYEKSRNLEYKTFVSSNFYNVSQVSLSTCNYNEKIDVLTVGMIVTTLAPWYGLERLIRSFSSAQNKYKLIIAGIDVRNEYVQKLISENGLQKNIVFLGKVSSIELVSFYNTVHICMGSLGLYKINLQYASTLKVKESISFGIPVVTAYNEEDFIKNKEFAPYYLQLENNDSLIDFDLIQQFAAKFYSIPENKTLLRNLALKYIDVNVKISQLLENIKP